MKNWRLTMICFLYYKFVYVIERRDILMDVKQLYCLIEDFFGYKCCMMGINSAEKTVFCILYDLFWLECSLNDRYGRFELE